MALPSITSGFGNKKVQQRHVPFNSAPVENTISSNDSKAQIVLGGDRTSDISSGYSGLGFDDSSAIDIVVGRGKTISQSIKDEAASINPDFFNDAARIYISEKADIDKYFKIAINDKSDIGNSVAASAIALKADSIRIIGVEGIRLVTRANPTNSNNNEPGYKGIELIAGNDPTYLQPMVKGDNLAKCIKEITINMSHLQSQINKIYEYLEKLTDNYARHVHPTAAPGPPSFSITASAHKLAFEIESIAHNVGKEEFNNKLTKLINDYLNVPSHDKNILSKYNKVN